MNERLETDLAALEGRGFPLQRHPQTDGWTFVILTGYPLPPGYNRERSNLLVKAPPPYPLAALDMFWMDPELRLANGSSPASTSVETVLDRAWLRFSWHPTTWRPSRDNLATFLGFIERRLREAR